MQVSREARNGRFVPLHPVGANPHPPRNAAVAEEERLAATFRRRARNDYQAN